MSSDNQKPRKRNFTMIYRFIQLALMMLIVFFLAFFITISVKTPHPIDYIMSAYFEDTKADKVIDDYEKEKKNERKSIAENESRSRDNNSNKNSDKDTSSNRDDKNSSRDNNSTTSLNKKIEKMKNIMYKLMIYLIHSVKPLLPLKIQDFINTAVLI